MTDCPKCQLPIHRGDLAEAGRHTTPCTVRFLEPLPACAFDDRPAIVDGRTAEGPWAYMCRACFVARGIGLGLGRGQRLVGIPDDGSWELGREYETRVEDHPRG